jgi:hypothetical protein
VSGHTVPESGELLFHCLKKLGLVRLAERLVVGEGLQQLQELYSGVLALPMMANNCQLSEEPRLSQGIVVTHRPLLQRVDMAPLRIGGQEALVERLGRLVEVRVLGAVEVPDQGNRALGAIWCAPAGNSSRACDCSPSSGWSGGMLEALIGLGALATAQGRPLLAAQLWGATEGLSRQPGLDLWPPDQLAYAEALVHARAASASDAFTAAWQAGRGLSWEAARALAEAVDKPT